MADINPYTPEKLVIPTLLSDLELEPLLRKKMQSLWGIIDSASKAITFEYTNYYTEEMGSPLYRIFYSFQDLVDPSSLADIKIMTNSVEQAFSRQGKRIINLDPGVLSQSKFILATTKNNAHRIPMTQGIYGELTLQYKKGAFRELEWTYPDYKSDHTRDYLLSVRNLYVKQLKMI